MIDFSIRRLQPGDSLDDLTSMLHRAFAPMGRRGLQCQSIDQTPATTRQRAERGDCFVAIADRRIAGTITLQAPDPSVPVRRYRSPEVASIHQFAVDPCYQGEGIGHALLQGAATWARARQYAELALDTPAPAGELRDYYARHGFRLIGLVQLAGRLYDSAVMAKAVSGVPKRTAIQAWPARHPAEMAAIAHEARARALRTGG
jgi:GNAT superfamily N-acetyltransferase